MPAWAPPVRPSDVVGTGHGWLEPVDQEGVHKGVDLQLTKGKPALSPVDGVVSDVGNDPEGLGITVTIRDAQGTETKLGHLDGVHVKKGDQVKQGQQVADVGETGASTGPHLDVRMQDKDGQYQDPTAMLGSLAQMPRADQPTGAGQGQYGGPAWQSHQGIEPPGEGPAGQESDLDIPRFRGYYEQIARMNPEGPQPGTPAFEQVFQRAIRGAMPGQGTGPTGWGGYDPMYQPAMPSRNAMMPGLPGVAGLASSFPQQFMENLVQPGMQAIGEWFNPPPAYAPGLDDTVGGGQGAPPGWGIPDDPTYDAYGARTAPELGEFTSEGVPENWRHLPPAMPLAGIPGWLQELSQRYNIPPEIINPDFFQQSQPIPPYNQAPWWSPGVPGEGQDRAVGVGQGQGGIQVYPGWLPSGGVYGQQKWLPGSQGTDVFLPRGSVVRAPFDGVIEESIGGQALNGGAELIMRGNNGLSIRLRHVQPQAQGQVHAGQPIGTVYDSSMDMLGQPGWGNMPDGYQHVDLSVNQGTDQFSPQGGGGGNMSAAQFLQMTGYQGQMIPKTPGPQDGRGGGGFGGQGGGMPFGMGMPGGGGMPFGMGMPGGGGMPFGMGMGSGFPGMPGGFGMPGGGQGGMPGGFGMGMPGMSPGMGMDMGMTSPMGMGQPGGMGMFGDPSMGGGLGGMDPGMGMSTGMGSMDPMAMGAGPMGDFSGWGGGGGGSPDMSSMLGGFGGGQFGGGGFGGGGQQFGGQQFGGGGFGGQQGQQGQGGLGGLGSQMQSPAFSGFPGAMPGTGFSNGGLTGNPATLTAADNLMQQELAFKPDWTGINAAQDVLKKNATTPLAALPINTNQLPAAPKSALEPWRWLEQIYPGSGQDRAPVGSGQDRPRWDVGVGQSVTPTNTPFTGTLTTDPGQAVSGNLNQQYFQLAQQQLQEQIQQVNQSFQQQQQQLAQQASQFGMTTQLQQQQQQLQQQQFDANQKLQRQLAELQNAQLQQNLGMQSQQFNQQMGLQGAQLGMNAQQFNQQMGLQGAQFGLQEQQLGMLPQQLAAQYGLSAAQLGQGQQQLGVQVQQLNQQYQQAQQAAYQSYLTSGNQDQYQRELANMNAKFQQAQAQIQQAQYGGNMQLQQQQLRGQTGLSLAQMAQQQQQAGFGRQMDIFNSAMSQPWLQQLSGMAPQWGAAGGPQEAGQAAAAGMPNMPSQGGGINLPDLNQYFPDINVQQYLQGQTPQMGASPFQNNWQSVMSGLGQFSPFNQNQISLPNNPFPFQMPQFSLGQNPYSFNFSPVSSQFNFSPTSVPLEGQMPWAINPQDPNQTTPPTNNPTDPNNPASAYQAGPLTFTGPGTMGGAPTGYLGAGSTYTLPNGQTFNSQDVWNWEQSNAGSTPDTAYQYEMGQHGFPGWNFPIGQGGGFPIGSTVQWNMGPAAPGATPPPTPPMGSGQDRVGSGQDMSWLSGGSNPLTQGDSTGWGMGPVQQGGGLGGFDWGNGGGANPLTQGDYTGWGMGPMQQGGGGPWNFGGPLTQGDYTGFGMGPVQQGGLPNNSDPYAGWGPSAPPTQTPQQQPGAPDQGTGDATTPPSGNTTGDAYKQYQQALAQWQQQQQQYQGYGQKETDWQNAWNQFYGNWRQHFGQPGYDTSALAQWRQTNPEPTQVANPGAPPQYQALNPVDFSHWITQQAQKPYQAPPAPTMPNFETFAGMDPFQQAGLRTQAQLSGIAWPQYQNMMRQNWGAGGVTQPQIQSPLSMANIGNNTLNNMSWDNVLSVFGQTPQQYQTTYSPYWSQAQASNVSGIQGGGY